MIAWLDDPATPLPPTSQALGADSDAPGLLAAGGELTSERLREAYSRGIFPWFGPRQPVLWWAPDPRMVLPVQRFKPSRSLRKTLTRFLATPGCEVRIDHAFERVIRACATTLREGQSGTWIVPQMQRAYVAWHREGMVHSFETWFGDELAGGLYAVCLGRMVFGESMFSLQRDASKIALAALVAFCRDNGIAWIDCQQNTTHLASLGAHEVSRPEFEAHVRMACQAPAPTDWTYHRRLWRWLDERLAAPSSASADT